MMATKIVGLKVFLGIVLFMACRQTRFFGNPAEARLRIAAKKAFSDRLDIRD